MLLPPISLACWAGVIAMMVDVITTQWCMCCLADIKALLDMLITPHENGRLNTSVYRKATHTDQYLHWDSHRYIKSKYSVVGTLFHRAEQLVLNLDSC